MAPRTRTSAHRTVSSSTGWFGARRAWSSRRDWCSRRHLPPSAALTRPTGAPTGRPCPPLIHAPPPHNSSTHTNSFTCNALRIVMLLHLTHISSVGSARRSQQCAVRESAGLAAPPAASPHLIGPPGNRHCPPATQLSHPDPSNQL